MSTHVGVLSNALLLFLQELLRIPKHRQNNWCVISRNKDSV